MKQLRQFFSLFSNQMDYDRRQFAIQANRSLQG